MIRTSPHRTFHLAALLLVVAFLPFHVLASMEIFLQIEGVPGESTKDKFANTIEVESFSHQIGSANTTNKAAVHANVAVVKLLDKSTPPLLLAANTGTPFKTATITFRKPSGTQTVFYKIMLTDVVVTAVGTTANARGLDALPLNELTFKYAAIRWEYTLINPATGAADGSVATSWDVVKNQPLP